MEPELQKKQIRFYEIDLLRFLAALTVVIFHYTYRGYAEGNYSPVAYPWLGQFTKYGFLGVELFFMISGYVVLLSAQGKTVRQFFLSRVTRLYPAFWAACTLTFLVKRIWGTGPADSYMSPNLWADVKQYVFSMTMLHSFFGLSPIDGAYWSLSVEIVFYFLISLLIGYKLLRHIDFFIASWLVYAALPSALHMGTPFAGLLLPDYAPYFAAGMLFYLLQQPAERTWQRVGLLGFAYLLALRCILGQIAAATTTYHDAFSAPVAGIAITGFFLLFGLITLRIINLSKWTWLAWPGALTYSLYLLHSDIGFIVFHRLGHAVNKHTLLVNLVAAMILVAYLLHIGIEKRFSKLFGKQVSAWLTYFD
ncbi:MAG: acyltransferase [Hymenobacter sp.]|nr:MAG: acyltransferase [Hymenobacter sp.]